ncbi:MAG TPA: hypothetical protein VE914_13225 [Candidatus Angelobacter sp.]|nr:hypothetical protein [Candidatus Angelobacter sp.]
MTPASARPPIFEGGPFGGWLRSRSGDSDWDFFPFGRWGRGNRVGEDEVARLRRLERLVLGAAFLTMIGAAFVLGALLPVPVAVHVRFYIGFAVLLAVKPGFNAVAAWLIRHNPAAERPFTWVELREPAAAAKMSLRWLLVAMAIPTAMATAAMAVAVAMPFRAMAEMDIERRWFWMISGIFFAVIGIYYAYRPALIVRLYLAGRRPR